MSRKFAILTVLIALLTGLTVPAAAQTQINPATQVRWPAVSGTGAPASPQWPCTSANYGQPYTDVSTGKGYVCVASGWQRSSSDGLPAGDAGQIPTYVNAGTTVIPVTIGSGLNLDSSTNTLTATGGGITGTIQPTPPLQLYINPTGSTTNTAGPASTTQNAVTPLLQGTANCDQYGSCATALAGSHTNVAIPSTSSSTEVFPLSLMNFGSNTATLAPGIPVGGQVFDPRHGATRYSVDSPTLDNGQVTNALGGTFESRQVQFLGQGSAIFPQDIPFLGFKTTQGNILRTTTNYASGQGVMDGRWEYSYCGDCDFLTSGNITAFASSGTEQNAGEPFHAGVLKMTQWGSNLVLPLQSAVSAGATSVSVSGVPGTPNVGQDRWAVDITKLATSPCSVSGDGTNSVLHIGVFVMSGSSCFPADTTFVLSTAPIEPVVDTVTSAVLASGVMTVTLSAPTTNDYTGTRVTMAGFSGVQSGSPFLIPSDGRTTVQTDSTHFHYTLIGYLDATVGSGQAWPQSAGTQTVAIQTSGVPTDVSTSLSSLPSTGQATVSDSGKSAGAVYSEVVNYTVVDGTHITLTNLHNPHTSNVLIGIGGYAGSIAIPDANVRGSLGSLGSGTLFDFTPLLGCKQASGTCYVANTQAYGVINGEGAATNVSSPIGTITCSGGVNTVFLDNPITSNGSLYTGVPFTVAGNSTINGTFVATFQNAQQYTFSQTCSASSGTGGTATFDNSQISFAPAFRIYYATDLSTATQLAPNGVINGNFVTSPASANLAASDEIVFPNEVNPQGPSGYAFIQQLLRGAAQPPSGGWGGLCIGLQGPSRACLQASIQVSALSDYIGHGGSNRLPGRIAILSGLSNTATEIEDGDVYGILHDGNSFGVANADYVPDAYKYASGVKSWLLDHVTGNLSYNGGIAASQLVSTNNPSGGNYDSIILGTGFADGAGPAVSFRCTACNSGSDIVNATIRGALKLGGSGVVGNILFDVDGEATTSMSIDPTSVTVGNQLHLPGLWNTTSDCQFTTIGADATTGSLLGVQPCDTADFTSGTMAGVHFENGSFSGTDLVMDGVTPNPTASSQTLIWNVGFTQQVEFGRPLGITNSTGLFGNGGNGIIMGDDNGGYFHVTATDAEFNGSALSTAASVTAAIAAAQTVIKFTSDPITHTALTNSCETVSTSVPGALVGSPVSVSTSDGSDWWPFDLRARVAAAGTVITQVCGTGTPAFTTTFKEAVNQ